MQEAFEAAPAVIIAKQTYLRLEPGVYESMIKAATLTRATDEEILKRAKAIYDDRFNGSYHAGPLAIIPPAKTFFADIESEKYGHVIFEEGDFLRLVRVTPYKSVYPSYFVNPKR
jgi:1,2-phenylacetyl-CoA epoxidase PaaB subunit